MSCLEKLLIRGIRSFGPSENDQVIVEFYTPLTLIAGQNGAGKTTIIECLRYVTTGDLPPNSKGGAFVCDPKLVGKIEVKGCVKLKFKDVIGNEVVCHRIIQSTQKPKKIEQRQIDGSMEKTDKNTGEKRKLTSKCAEIDYEMVDHLGVSKAILNNVVFCHQEDSNWPLSEGKALKTKFDEIFASTRYSKALETIKKFQSDQRSKCNEYNAELKYLKEEKLKADELQSRLKETQRKFDASKDEATRISNELKPVEERIEELNNMYDEVTQMERKLAELESSRKELGKQQETLQSKIQHQFTGSYDELQSMYDRHHHQLERDHRNLKEYEEQSSRLTSDETRLKTQVTELSKEYGRLEAESKQNQQLIKSRNERVSSVAKDIGIPGYNGQLSNESVRQFLSEVVQYRERKEEHGKKEKDEYLSMEESLGKQVTELRDNLSRAQQKKEMREKQLSDNVKQLQVLNKQLARVGGASSAFERIEMDLKQSEQELQEYKDNVDVIILERELKEFGVQKKRVGEQVSTLQQEQNIITQQSSARGALDNMQKDKQSKEQQYQNKFAQIEADLLSLMGSMPSDDDIEKSIGTLERTKRATLQKTQFKYNKLNSDISRIQAQLDEKLKQLKGKRDLLEVFEEEVRLICGGTTFDDKLKQVGDNMCKVEEDLTTVKGSQVFFKQCLTKARSSRKCPLCARGYDSQDGLDNLITSIERRMNNKAPELVQTYEHQLQQVQQTHEKLIQLKPKIDQIQKLKGEDIPLLEKEVTSKTNEIETLKQDIHVIEKQQTELQSQVEQVRKLHPQAVHLTHLQQELKKLDRNISTELSKLGGGETVRTHAVVHRELQKAQMQAEELGRKMDNKRQEISTSEKSIRELENKVHSLKKEKLELQEQVQQRQNLVSKKEELTTSNEGLKRDIEAASHQLKPLDIKLNEVEKELRRVRNDKERCEYEHRTEMSLLINKENEIKKYNSTINSYEARGSSVALEECSSKMADFQQRTKNKMTERKEVDDKLDTLRKQLANAKVRERELEDNLELLKNQSDVTDKETSIKRIHDQLKRRGLDKHSSEYQRLKKEAEKLRKDKARFEGHCQGKQDELRHIQKDLQSDMYRDVDKRYRDMNVTLQTTMIANCDLDKYYKALDRAIMRFHSIKMEEINKIIKELWMKTYKGGDIDTIAIRSESDVEIPEGVVLSGRRIYHYRVVMVKEETELDMRGRCSAGQKVLASIIIRLALAETFCLNCGILVLDEPTTNLDNENVEGLAQSLVDIIRERSRQKNFQLVLITHDLRFVELIGRSGAVDKFSLVKKSPGCFSSVSKTPISKLPTYN